MISFSKISKQYGRQVLFVDASFQLNPGEKVGLVGPNGSGKTTLFRMIIGEEVPDEGDVSVPKKLTDRLLPPGRRGDVRPLGARRGDRRQRPRRRSAPRARSSCSTRWRIRRRPTTWTRILARFGEVQEEYDHLGGYALEAQAREVLHGLGFDDERIDGDVGALSGGWKMRVAMARVLLGRPDVLLMDEPTNHLDIESIIWLESFLKSLHRRAADDVARSRLHEPHRHEDRRDRRRRDHDLLGQLRLLRARARDPRGQPRGGVRAPAGDARQGAALHRALRRARRQGGAGAEPREGAREDREDRAAEEARGREVRLPPAAALGRPGRDARGRDEDATASASSTTA